MGAQATRTSKRGLPIASARAGARTMRRPTASARSCSTRASCSRTKAARRPGAAREFEFGAATAGDSLRLARMKLWIGNLDPQTTDDELREFLGKYTKLKITEITRHPGDGSRPAAMIELEGTDLVALDAAQRRLHGMYWKNRALHVAIPSR